MREITLAAEVAEVVVEEVAIEEIAVTVGPGTRLTSLTAGFNYIE
jgi:hypothetical protein